MPREEALARGYRAGLTRAIGEQGKLQCSFCSILFFLLRRKPLCLSKHKKVTVGGVSTSGAQNHHQLVTSPYGVSITSHVGTNCDITMASL